MLWEAMMMGALILGGLAGAFGVWHVLEDLILDSVPLPCPRPFDDDAAASRD